MNRFEKWDGEEGWTLLAGWKREGKSLEEISELAGVQVSTLKSWMNRSAEIRAALTEDARVTDFQVERALLKKALGYESVEKKVEVSAKGERKEVETTKQVGPDMSAISFWLKKRKPQQWGDGMKAEEKPENNLHELLEQEGGIDTDAIPELQSQTAAGADMVEED